MKTFIFRDGSDQWSATLSAQQTGLTLIFFVDRPLKSHKHFSHRRLKWKDWRLANSGFLTWVLKF